MGSKLTIELYFKETDPFPIRLQGVCRWSRCENDDSVSGLDISGSHDRSLEVIKAYLRQSGDLHE